MVRTQIQLPDELYARLKAEARQRESTLAEVLRRAAEQYLATRPQRPMGAWQETGAPWPTLDLGPIRVPAEQLRDLANPDPEV